MRRRIAKLAKFLGVNTWYHVAYMYQTPTGYGAGSGTFRVSPWARNGNLHEIIEIIKTPGALPGTIATITSITRIGA